MDCIDFAEYMCLTLKTHAVCSQFAVLVAAFRFVFMPVFDNISNICEAGD
jgi:hypothetical protein